MGRRQSISYRSQIEEIELLDPSAPWRDLLDKLAKRTKVRKFAIVSRIPTVDSTYYLIPYYAALRYVYQLIASEHTADEIKTLFIIIYCCFEDEAKIWKE